MLTQKYVASLIDYDPSTGEMRWKERPIKMFDGEYPRRACTAWNARYAGRRILSEQGNGYLRVIISRVHFLQHRIAWLLVHGRLPSVMIDHINGNKKDNRIANLREASAAENMQNQSMLRRNSSGLLGVHWNENHMRWTAEIKINGRKIHVGEFSEKEDAFAAYQRAKAKFHTFNPMIRSA